MGFLSLSLYGFRNLHDGKINLDAHNVYLVGENGQGKTNFLETLYLLSYGSSFRTRNDVDFIRWDRSEMRLSCSYTVADEPVGKISLTIQNGNKSMQLNDKIVTDRKILLNQIPSVAFVHDDFLLSGGPPEKRRRFMDQTLSLYDPLYVDMLRRYRRILKERNHLLKTRNTALLNHYSEHLVSLGLPLMEHRRSMIQSFGPIFSSLFREVSGLDCVDLVYRPSWGDSDSPHEILARLEDREDNDMAQGTTTTGPHRDDMAFMADKRNFSKTASTGQRRLLSLILKVAQARFYLERTGKKPLLLLDDVLLELDPRRRQLFRERLPEAEQIIYTFLPGEDSNYVEGESITLKVEEGHFHEWK